MNCSRKKNNIKNNKNNINTLPHFFKVFDQTHLLDRISSHPGIMHLFLTSAKQLVAVLSNTWMARLHSAMAPFEKKALISRILT
jgi:hypothetical protein